MFNSAKKIFCDKGQRFMFFASLFKYFPNMSDEEYLKRIFEARMGRKLNLDNPCTFSEKLQWLKLYDRRPEYTMMVDKYAVKKYIAETIGEEYLIPTLGVWDNFDDIDFDNLPNQFVLKCTHDSGGLVICRDKKKFDKEKAKNKISKCMKRNYFLNTREWPYKNVTPRIIAEKYMEDEHFTSLNDYKLMCFNGEVKCTFVCSDRSENLKVTFFDNNWKRLPFERHYPASTVKIPKPANFEKMIELAEKLSKGLPFVRVDFYEVNGKIYFGELTFYPGAGLEKFKPEQWDRRLGDWIVLPEK